jgi:hypothetical protein
MTHARRSIRSVLFFGALVAALAGAACDKGDKKGGGGGGKGMAGASSIAPQGGLTRALSMMPSSSEFVAAIDFSQVRKSALWKKYEPMVLERAGKELAEFKTLCGFDPIEKASGLVVGGRGKDMAEATILVRGFDKASVTTCVQKAVDKAKAEGKPTTAVIDGNYFEITGSDGQPARFAFVDDQTIIVKKSGEETAGKDALLAAIAAKPADGLMSSPTFAAIIDGVDTGAALWFVVKGNASFIPAGGMGMKFDAAFGSVNLGDGVSGTIKVRMPTADEAKSIVTMGKSQMEQLKASPFGTYVKNVSLAQKDKDVGITFKFDQGQIESMAGMAESMGGGF